MIRTFKKKPIPVKVCQYTKDTEQFLIDWSTETPSDSPVYTPIVRVGSGIGVVTLEGTMCPKIGDYVVQGPAGEFWFVRKEIFEATYEEILCQN
jgi:hypothetical protein